MSDGLKAKGNNKLRASGRRVEVALGLPFTQRGPSYTCSHLAMAIESADLSVGMHTPVVVDNAYKQSIKGGLGGPALVRRLGWKFEPGLVFSFMERNILRALDSSGDNLVWTFGELPLSLSRSLHKRGVKVVREKFNCAKAQARAIISREHDRLGLPPFTGISDASLAKEAEEFELADAIFCPSPMVSASLLAQGVPQTKLIETSYGWDPARFSGSERFLPDADGPTLVFVGSLTVRKGIHILLEAWARANIGGRLILLGAMDPLVEARWGHLMQRPDVIYPGFINDVGAAYRSADWFIFPSLEEGGPQVTYEAAGCGVPALVTPMGAGAFTRDGREGLVLDSCNPDDWAELLSTLSRRKDQRDQMAVAAKARATEFCWSAVGARRRQQLLDLSLGPPVACA